MIKKTIKNKNVIIEYIDDDNFLKEQLLNNSHCLKCANRFYDENDNEYWCCGGIKCILNGYYDYD